MCFIPEIFNDNDGDCDICKKKGRIKWKVTCVMVKSNSVDRALHLQGRFCNTSLLWFWRLASLDFTLHPVSAYLPTLHEPDLGNLKSNWRELGEKEMMTTMRKPSWPQLRQQCYQARKFGDGSYCLVEVHGPLTAVLSLISSSRVFGLHPSCITWAQEFWLLGSRAKAQ